jgi:ABC-type glycerol-3-phosphate transport system substrate-binding protein
VALEPTLEADGSLLLVFRDATAPRETYGAGRFLSARAPQGGAVTLDFNRAFNPPCAFTPWATCPLPSPENVRSGKYPLSRPLFMYTRGAPSGEAKQFIDFCLSPAGQAIVTQVGYFPIQ